MKNILLAFVFFATAIISTYSQKKPVVIVELFTSEGCSSCPPADQLLSSIVNESYENIDVTGLSFHVDYWDHIGWKDPYSSKKYSDRQRSYAGKFFNSTIYTPQMVVNGKHEFVGSNRSYWNKALQKEMNTPRIPVTIRSATLNGDKISVGVEAVYQKKAILNAALVERGLIQQVTRGENRGRKLSHDNVVRDFEFKELEGTHVNFELTVPEGLDVSKSSVIVYLQDARTWYVIGAEKRRLDAL